MLTLSEILRELNYIPTELDLGDSEEPKPFISVAERIAPTLSRQVANIGIEFGRLTFYSGNGYRAGHNAPTYSTYLEDSDKGKFIIDFKNFVQALQRDPHSKTGFKIERIEKTGKKH